MASYDVEITKKNETFLKVQCNTPSVELDLKDRFKFEAPNSRFDYRVKKGYWDGNIRLYDSKKQTLYTGLLQELVLFLSERDISFNISDDLFPPDDTLDRNDLLALIEELFPLTAGGNAITPHDYQLDSVAHMLSTGRSTILAATSAGKSLILYLACRMYSLMDDLDGKSIMICVPSSSLVEQLYSDFEDYSQTDPNWFVGAQCQKISGKYAKSITKKIVITTWQSASKLNAEDVNDEFGVVFVDECHTASAATLTRILAGSTKIQFRHGLTGSLDRVEANEMVIQGLLGPKKRIIKAHELISRGLATKIKVDVLVIRHSEEARKELATIKKAVPNNDRAKVERYNAEIEYINAMEDRRSMIYTLTHAYPGNSIILFDRVESFGEEMYNEYKETHPNTFFISGDVKAEDREKIRVEMENYDDAVLWASYGTCQQGMSIKKLNNMVLASSSKSVVRVLQSIGRMMRLHSSKTFSTIIDIVDDFTYDDEPNYTLEHAKKRLEYYDEEKYEVKFHSIEI